MRKFKFIGDGKERIYDDHIMTCFGVVFMGAEPNEVPDSVVGKFEANSHFKEVTARVSYDYAVYKIGGSKAVKIFDERYQAEEFIEGKDYEIRERER